MLSGLRNVITFEEFRTAVEDLATVEGRLLASGVIVLLLIVLGGYLLPWLIGMLNRTVKRTLLTDGTRALVDGINAYIPTTIGDLFVRLLQLVVVFTGVLALLITWGLVDLAGTVLRYAGISFPLLVRIAFTVALFVGAYIGVHALENAVNQYSEGADRITQHQQEIILRMGHVSILIVATLGALSLWRVDLSGILIGAGFLGIVVGLAARQTLGSMIAGFVLMFSRPFSIGDWVEIGGREGIVTKITIMQTRMQNFDGESIVIPNDVVANQPITNRTRQGILRIRTEVGIDYEADPERAEQLALETIEDIDAVASSPPPDVVPTRFGDSAVVLELRFWIENPDPPSKWDATRAVIHEVKAAFGAEDIAIPFPQRELSARGGDGLERTPAPVSTDGDSGGETTN